MTKVVVFLQ